MIAWDSQEVARFLGVQAQQPHGEDTEFIFAFESGGQPVHLVVQPYNDYAIVTLGKPEGHAQLRTDCASVRLEDPADEGVGPSLVLRAPSIPGSAGGDALPSPYWIRITAVVEGFRIESSFAFEETPERRVAAVPGGRRPLWGCVVVIMLIAAAIALIGFILPLLTA